jgi:flavin reductase (DIM6/NTAB) family NADH-FMN oxidoreductase RutF
MEAISEKEAYQLTKPMIYTLVTSLDKNGNVNALGVSWLTKVSTDPPLWIISIDPRRYSYEGIDLHKEFVINFPVIEQADGAILCGTISGRNQNKLDMANLDTIPSIKIKTPTIKDCLVSIECKVVNQFIAGDHTIFVGEVVACQADKSKSAHIYVTSDYTIFALDKNGKNIS